MRVFVWLAHKNEHLSLNVGNVLERITCMNNKKLMDSSTDEGYWGCARRARSFRKAAAFNERSNRLNGFNVN